MTTDYKPVSCEIYSGYELDILHKNRLQLVWQDQDITHTAVVLPLDLKTELGEEFLIARDNDDGSIKVRLDRISKKERI